MTASPTPTPTFAVPGDVGLPSEETIARAIASLRKHLRPDSKLPDILPSEMAQAAAVYALIRPAFEAKELHHVSGERITRKDLNNAYREGSEKGRLAAHLIDGVNSPLNVCCYRDQCRALLDRALSAEAKLAQAVEALEPFAKMADEVSDKTGVPDKQISDDTFMFVRLGSCRRARSASARGET